MVLGLTENYENCFHEHINQVNLTPRCYIHGKIKQIKLFLLVLCVKIYKL